MGVSLPEIIPKSEILRFAQATQPDIADRNENELIPLSSRGTAGAVAISKIKIFFGDHHVASLLVMTDSIGNFETQRVS